MNNQPIKQSNSSCHAISKKDILNVLTVTGIQSLKNLNVLGVSMEPTIQPGDRVNIERGVYLPGDILLFVRDEKLVLHRMVGWWKSQGKWCHITKGDNLPSIDRFVPSDAIVGKVISWERNGKQYIESRMKRFINWLTNVGGYLVTRATRSRYKTD